MSCMLRTVSDTETEPIRCGARDPSAPDERTVDVVSLPFALPTGTVTFLLTDVEGSTVAWQRHPESMSAAIARHDEIVVEAIAAWSGARPVEQGEGDSVVAAFSRATDAIAAALDVQLALQREAWPDGIELRVPIGVHTGEAVQRDEGNYVGTAIIRTARIRNAANGGQILVPESAAAIAADALPDGAALVDVGAHRLKDLDRPEQLWLLTHPDLIAVDAALRTLDTYRHNLPVETTPLIGRVAELAALTDELGRERLVTLTGSGGVGKTRLAGRVGADVLDEFPGGVWWVDLAPLRDPRAIGRRCSLRSVRTRKAHVRPSRTRRIGCQELRHWSCSTTASTSSPMRPRRSNRCAVPARTSSCWRRVANRSGCPAR
jgi:class 3 adenylate cyclase